MDRNEKKLLTKNKTNNKKRIWLTSIAGIVTILVITIILNIILPFGKTAIVYAMKDAYNFVFVHGKMTEVKNALASKVIDEDSPDIAFEIPSSNVEYLNSPQIKVPFNLEIEASDQKSVDAGHSPWKLDPVFVAQVFVSLKISPQGIIGEYPIRYEDLNIIQITGTDAIVEILSDITPIKKVYLKRLIRQDSTGIWTVVGYTPVDVK